MNLRNDQRGFIFSLDAVLAVLVTLTVLAGVAQIGISSSTYEQHGYLRLERYAEDAIEVMHQTGALDNVIASIVKGNLSQASEIARDNLRAILPPEIQFKFLIGDEGNPYLDNVHPGTENQAWEGIFESVGERAVAIRVTGKRLIPLKVLVWVDTRLPSDQVEMIENFVDEIQMPSWDVRTESDESTFRNYLLGGMDWVPDVVFIPDTGGRLQDATINALIWHYNVRLGGVVGAGAFLYHNAGYNFPFFGIWARSAGIMRELGYENMLIVNHAHPVTAISPDYVGYAGNRYYIFEYYFLHPATCVKATPLVENLAYWPGSAHPWWWPSWYNCRDQDWVALTARWESVIGENQYRRTVLFNAHLAQSAMEGTGTDEWIDLARRAIEWASGALLRFEPIRLYVWRGEVVS